MVLFCYLCVVFFFVIPSCLFLAALLSPAWKELTSWLSCVWCFLVSLSLSHMVSWVRFAALLYRLLIFAFFLTLSAVFYQMYGQVITNWLRPLLKTPNTWNFDKGRFLRVL